MPETLLPSEVEQYLEYVRDISYQRGTRQWDVVLSCLTEQYLEYVRDISYQRGTRQWDGILSWLTTLNIEVPAIAGVFA